MRRFLPLLLAFAMLTSLAACGAASPVSGGSGSGNASGDSAASSAASSEPETPQVEPYTISDPTVEPVGDMVDGVPYAPWDGVVEHLFFHPLIAYPELAFDADAESDGLDDYMVTVDEYDKILQSIYDRGYILVDINDVWSETTGADGQPAMVRNTLYLPEGKKHLAAYHRLRMTPDYAVNPFDTPLG